MFSYNPHPLLSSFPFVICLIIFITEIVNFYCNDSYKKTTLYLLILFFIFTIITFISGYIGAEYANLSFKVPLELIEKHELYARIFILSLIPIVLFYYLLTSSDKIYLKTRIAFSLLLLLIISFVSYHGAQLVYSYGAGVELVK